MKLTFESLKHNYSTFCVLFSYLEYNQDTDSLSNLTFFVLIGTYCLECNFISEKGTQGRFCHNRSTSGLGYDNLCSSFQHSAMLFKCITNTNYFPRNTNHWGYKEGKFKGTCCSFLYANCLILIQNIYISAKCYSHTWHEPETSA